MKYLWVVEMFDDGARRPAWEPTLGVGLDRQQARSEMAELKYRNPNDRFRLCRYVREVVGCTTR